MGKGPRGPGANGDLLSGAHGDGQALSGWLTEQWGQSAEVMMALVKYCAFVSEATSAGNPEGLARAPRSLLLLTPSTGRQSGRWCRHGDPGALTRPLRRPRTSPPRSLSLALWCNWVSPLGAASRISQPTQALFLLFSEPHLTGASQEPATNRFSKVSSTAETTPQSSGFKGPAELFLEKLWGHKLMLTRQLCPQLGWA